MLMLALIHAGVGSAQEHVLQLSAQLRGQRYCRLDDEVLLKVRFNFTFRNTSDSGVIIYQPLIPTIALAHTIQQLDGGKYELKQGGPDRFVPSVGAEQQKLPQKQIVVPGGTYQAEVELPLPGLMNANTDPEGLAPGVHYMKFEADLDTSDNSVVRATSPVAKIRIEEPPAKVGSCSVR